MADSEEAPADAELTEADLRSELRALRTGAPAHPADAETARRERRVMELEAEFVRRFGRHSGVPPRSPRDEGV